MLRLETGEYDLWQWNTKQRFVLSNEPDATEVLFSKDKKDVISRIPYTENDIVYVNIPDILLQESGIIYIFIVLVDKDGVTTIVEDLCHVRSQPKPPDYVVDDDEILTWERLEDRINEMSKAIIPPGGMADQYLKKKSNEDFDVAWEAVSADTLSAVVPEGLPEDTAKDVQSVLNALAVKPSGIQSDWNQNDETQLDYVKNRIAYKENSLNIITIVPLEAYGPFTGSHVDIYMSYFPNSLHLSYYPLNSKVIVTWDGVDYVCRIKFFEDRGIRYIGNGSLLFNGHSGIVPTEEPFSYEESSWYTLETQSTHDVKVQVEVPAIHQMDSDLLASKIKNTAGSITSYSEGSSMDWHGASEVFNDYVGNVAAYGGHAEGFRTKADGAGSHAEGLRTMANGDGSHAEGRDTIARSMSGYPSHAEGDSSTAGGAGTHAEGYHTTASGNYSHSEGAFATTSGVASHAEGYKTTASGNYSHSEGAHTAASGNYSHSEGFRSVASGASAHAEGRETIAATTCQHVEGQFNVEDDKNKYAHIVGNGPSGTERSNAHTLDWSGNSWYAGDVLSGGEDMDDPNAISLKKLSKRAVQPDWNVNDPADPAYVRNRPMYTKAPVEIVWIDKAVSDDYGYLGIREWTKEIRPLTKYRFTIGDREIVKTSWYNQAYSWWQVGSFEEEFQLWYTKHNSTLSFLYFGCSEPITVSVVEIYEEVEKIPPKYLPDDVLAPVGKVTPEGGEIFNDYETSKARLYGHAEGCSTTAGWTAHAENFRTTASGDCSHAEGQGTIASAAHQHVQGKYNLEDAEGIYADIVGNGDQFDGPSNAHTLDWEGNSWYQGDVLSGGTDMDDPKAISLRKLKEAVDNIGSGSTGGPLEKLTFTGAVAAEYDGTKPVTVDIPAFGKSTAFELIRSFVVPQDPKTDQSGISWILSQDETRITGFKFDKTDTGKPFDIDDYIIAMEGDCKETSSNYLYIGEERNQNMQSYYRCCFLTGRLWQYAELNRKSKNFYPYRIISQKQYMMQPTVETGCGNKPISTMADVRFKKLFVWQDVANTDFRNCKFWIYGRKILEV